MVKHTPTVVVTFANTTGALAMERACKECAIPGRIIPVPSAIHAGCGFAWSADLAHRETIENFLKKKRLAYVKIHELVDEGNYTYG